MSSGFGISGSTGRCYPVWQEFSGCMEKTGDPQDCQPLRDDYLECLHHRKEFGRLNAIHRERERKRKHPGGEHGKEH
eukprot:jgi/Astpho2/7355/e_gw1.00114.274.1_t